MVDLYDSEKHYATLEGWWKGHGQTPVPEAFLPKLGYISYRDGEPVCAAWVAMSNSHGVCYMEFFVTNPDFKAHKLAATRDLFTVVKNTLKELGYSIMFAAVDSESKAVAAERFGFTRLSNDMIHLVAKT